MDIRCGEEQSLPFRSMGVIGLILGQNLMGRREHECSIHSTSTKGSYTVKEAVQSVKLVF